MCGLMSDLVIFKLEKVWSYMTPKFLLPSGVIKQHKPRTKPNLSAIAVVVDTSSSNPDSLVVSKSLPAGRYWIGLDLNPAGVKLNGSDGVSDYA